MARFSTRTLVSVTTTTATVPVHCISAVGTGTCLNRRRRRDLSPIALETDDRWVSLTVLWLHVVFCGLFTVQPGRCRTKVLSPGHGGDVWGSWSFDEASQEVHRGVHDLYMASH